MASRKTVLLLVAGVIAVTTVIVARSLLKPEEAAQAPAPVVTTEIMAAAHDMPTGSILKENDLKWIPWSADAVQGGKFLVKDKNKMEDVVGAVLREGLHADEPLLSSRVVHPHEQGFLAAVLTPGKRAMAVTLTPSAGVAGFVFPGDHVDVILTHNFSRKDISDMNDRYISETVLSDVRVLALDQKSDNQSNDPKVAQLATLEVTPKQAEKLALASTLAGQNNGGHASLSLVLRSLAIEGDGTEPQPAGGSTWDSDVSLAFPGGSGGDVLIQKVQVMRGKETTESNFERRRKP